MMTRGHEIKHVRLIALILIAFWAITLETQAEFKSSGKLEIHYINVGQGGSTLIIGPNGTRILYDFGGYPGNKDIVPYLRGVVKLQPSDGLHYTIVSHRDRDHYMGYKDVTEAGYDVLIANYDSGSPKKPTKTIQEQWLKPAGDTTAGKIKTIPVGFEISLGDGAKAIVMAANGQINGEKKGVKIKDENDRSVAIFIHYRNFQYLLDGDLGSGPEECTKHQTTQKDVQTRVAQALLKQGLMNERNGVDVLHIAHHGSESSTSAAYYNLMKPEVGLINVGKKNSSYLHPRGDVVDRVLIGNNRAECVSALPLKGLFQTEDGEEGCSSKGCTSFSGRAIGDIKLLTDGRRNYTIQGSNRVHGGAKEAENGKVWSFLVDEAK
jgi:beta-lactamase superfamily II metal-dependent hydrolase